MTLDQEKPVAAPRNVTDHRSQPDDMNRHVGRQAVTGHVRDLDRSVLAKLRGDHANGRLDSVCSWSNPAEVSERGDDAYRAVPAHAQVTDVIEIDHARGA